MGLTRERLHRDLDAVAAHDPAVAGALERCGYPEPRVHPTGYHTMLRTIIGQQVSVASAASTWARLEQALGKGFAPADLLARDFDELRACGLSRQKQGYARSLCELVDTNVVDFADLPSDDEAAIAELTKIKGIGRWSAEIYLLFAEGRPDIWPAGDLAVQQACGRLYGLAERPNEVETRVLAEPWRPRRGAMAIFTWHVYGNPAL